MGTRRRWIACSWLVTALLGMLLTHPAHGEALPKKGSVDGRVRTAIYNAEEVYRLYGFVGYEIELVFDEGETFEGNAGGDLEAITFGWHTNHLILKPKAANVGTNLVIYTSRRAYRFEYSVSAKKPNSQTDEVIYTVQFVYPDSLKKKGRAEDEAELELARADSSRPRNTDYWFCGTASLKPIAASDDGVHTRLTFGSKAELPAIFVRNDDGSESLLNFSVAAGDIVIHRVAPKFILRRGALTGCVVNKGFIGSGERLESGTVAPEVVRERKERE